MSAGPPIPDELWQQIPPAAQAAIRALIQRYEQRLADLETRLNQNSTNSSKPPSSDPPALKRAPPKLPSHKKASKTLPWDEARDKMDQAVHDLTYGRHGKIDASILEPMAYIHVRQGSPSWALAVYAELEQSGPLSAAQLNNRAFCCIQLAGGPDRAKLLAQAETDLESAGAMTPNCQAIYYNRTTIALVEGGASQQSLNDIERAVQLGPATYALYRDAALLYGRSADLRRAPVMLDAPIATALFFEARSRRIERALYYARESIALGQYPPQFKLFRNLVPPATLSELLAMQPPPVVAPIELRLIEPVGELD